MQPDSRITKKPDGTVTKIVTIEQTVSREQLASILDALQKQRPDSATQLAAVDAAIITAQNMLDQYDVAIKVATKP